MKSRRVVVTGLGAITPIGNSAPAFWQHLCEGRNGVGPITAFDPSAFACRIAAEVKSFDPSSEIPQKDLKRMDRFSQYAVVAAREACRDGKLDMAQEDPHRVGTIVGSGIGSLWEIEKQHLILLEKGPERMSPFLIPTLIVNIAPGHVSINLGLKGPNSCVATACASGNHAIGDAFKIIQREAADVMFAGGTESCVTRLGIGGFAAMRALSTRNDDPGHASRPFDRDRDGFVMGEGCGILLLEELARARRRKARIYAELIGYGMSGDAYHMTSPCPDGDGAARCMRLALEDAGVRPEEVGYVNAHGTSTPVGDVAETMAIKQVFGAHAKRLPVSSIKSMIGHLLGASGGVEGVATVLSLSTGILPPTINYEHPDPECDLDYVPNAARQTHPTVAISNSFGFGGHNATLVFRKFTG